MNIEAGCKAVIVNSKAGNNGIVVTVLGVANENIYESYSCTIWNIDKCIITSLGRETNTIPELALKRIDDDSRQVVSWEGLADIWVPKIPETVEDRL